MLSGLHPSYSAPDTWIGSSWKVREVGRCEAKKKTREGTQEHLNVSKDRFCYCVKHDNTIVEPSVWGCGEGLWRQMAYIYLVYNVCRGPKFCKPYLTVIFLLRFLYSNTFIYDTMVTLIVP